MGLAGALKPFVGLFYKMVDLSYFILFVGYNFAIKTPLKYIITPKQ